MTRTLQLVMLLLSLRTLASLARAAPSGAAGVAGKRAHTHSHADLHLLHDKFSTADGHTVQTHTHTHVVKDVHVDAPNQCNSLEDVEGFLIDLDGTMYNPRGLIDGARDFFSYLESSKKPYVFLSNSATKGPEGVQAKFLTPPFNLSPNPISLAHIRTAAEAVADFLTDHAPADSKIFLLQSFSKYGSVVDSCLNQINSRVPEGLRRSWEIRTDLTDGQVKQWASLAKAGKENVFVVVSSGDVHDTQDPVTGQPGYLDWSFDLMSKATWLLQNGGVGVVSAPDTHNAVYDPDFPDLNLNTPGPGTIHQLLLSATYPDSDGRIFNVGKGTRDGVQYMMQPGLDMLARQAGRPLRCVAMVGDTLDTDIAAARLAGTASVFVLSGFHTRRDMPYYPDDVPTFILDNVGQIAPAAAQ